MALILIVDDEPLIRLIIKDNFQCEHNVLEAGNGQEALLLAKQNTVDLIITDINMPEMNGIDFLSAIRTVNAKVKVIVMSASCYDSEKIEFILSIGANAVLQKPFDFRMLENKVSKLLNAV